MTFYLGMILLGLLCIAVVYFPALAFSRWAMSFFFEDRFDWRYVVSTTIIALIIYCCVWYFFKPSDMFISSARFAPNDIAALFLYCLFHIFISLKFGASKSWRFLAVVFLVLTFSVFHYSNLFGSKANDIDKMSSLKLDRETDPDIRWNILKRISQNEQRS